MESRPFLSRIPDQGILTADGGGTGNRIQATRSSDGSYLMVYSQSGRAFSINMSKLSGTTAHTWWFDPRTGNVTDNGTWPIRGSVQFTPASSGYGHDWVLVADDAARGFGQPGR
jgi:hypothetical protein